MKKRIVILGLCLCLSLPVLAGIIPSGLTDDGSSLFTLTDANSNLDDSGFEMLFEFGQFNSSDHAFGIYQYNTSGDSIGNSIDIFRSGDSVGDSSNLVWDLGNSIASTRYGSFALDAGLEFGLYFASDSTTYYSQSQFNAKNEDFFSFFWQSDQFDVNNLYVKAWDDGTSWNYDTMTVGISDVSQLGASGSSIPVPEPASIALLGLALVGFRVLHTSTKYNC